MTEKCKLCGSYAINPGHHDRPEFDKNIDNDLCDVCFWKVRANKLKTVLTTFENEVQDFTGVTEDTHRNLTRILKYDKYD
jgi:hypothetical protein